MPRLPLSRSRPTACHFTALLCRRTEKRGALSLRSSTSSSCSPVLRRLAGPGLRHCGAAARAHVRTKAPRGAGPSPPRLSSAVRRRHPKHHHHHHHPRAAWHDDTACRKAGGLFRSGEDNKNSRIVCHGPAWTVHAAPARAASKMVVRPARLGMPERRSHWGPPSQARSVVAGPRRNKAWPRFGGSG
eukprot:scaffold1173_cov405-Prasinococcus_capsulatus_cf.AAC.14